MLHVKKSPFFRPPVERWLLCQKSVTHRSKPWSHPTLAFSDNCCHGRASTFTISYIQYTMSKINHFFWHSLIDLSNFKSENWAQVLIPFRIFFYRVVTQINQSLLKVDINIWHETSDDIFMRIDQKTVINYERNIKSLKNSCLKRVNYWQNSSLFTIWNWKLFPSKSR